MDPDIRKQIEIVEGMIADQRDPEIIRQYLRTQGYESSEQWREARRSFEQEQQRLVGIAQQPRPEITSDVGGRIGLTQDPAEQPVPPENMVQTARGIADVGLFGFADEIEGALRPDATAEGIRFVRNTRDQGALAAGQLIGMGTPSGIGTAIGRGLGGLQRAPGLIGRIGAGTAIGAGEGLAYGMGSAEGGFSDRLTQAGGETLAGGAIGLGIPTIGAAGGLAYNAGRRLAGRRSPEGSAGVLYDIIGMPTSQLERLSPGGRGTLAESLGEGGTYGENIIKGIGMTMGPETSRRAGALAMSRRQGAAEDLNRAATVVAPGTSPNRRALPDNPRVREAQALLNQIDPEIVTQREILDVVDEIQKAPGGGSVFRGSRASGRHETEPLTWEELRELESRLNPNKMGNEAQPKKLSDLHDELRTRMEAASPEYAEAMGLYRRGSRATEIDQIAEDVANTIIQDGSALPKNPPPKLLEDLANTVGPEKADEFMQLWRGLRQEQSMNNALRQASGAGARQSTREGGGFASFLTGAGYVGAGQVGAAFRTFIAELLRGPSGARRVADELVDLLLDSSFQTSLREVTRAGRQLERGRQRSMQRTGLLSAFGSAVANSGLLNQGGR